MLQNAQLGTVDIKIVDVESMISRCVDKGGSKGSRSIRVRCDTLRKSNKLDKQARRVEKTLEG